MRSLLRNLRDLKLDIEHERLSCSQVLSMYQREFRRPSSDEDNFYNILHLFFELPEKFSPAKNTLIPLKKDNERSDADSMRVIFVRDNRYPEIQQFLDIMRIYFLSVKTEGVSFYVWDDSISDKKIKEAVTTNDLNGPKLLVESFGVIEEDSDVELIFPVDEHGVPSKTISHIIDDLLKISVPGEIDHHSFPIVIEEAVLPEDIHDMHWCIDHITMLMIQDQTIDNSFCQTSNVQQANAEVLFLKQLAEIL